MRKFVVALALLGYVSSAKLDNLRYLPPDNRNLPSGGNHESGLVAPNQSAQPEQPGSQYGATSNTQRSGSSQNFAKFPAGNLPAQKFQSAVAPGTSEIAGNGFGRSQNFEKPIEQQSHSFGSFPDFSKPTENQSSSFKSNQDYAKPIGVQPNGFGLNQEYPNNFGNSKSHKNPTSSQSNVFESSKDYPKSSEDKSATEKDESNSFQPAKSSAPQFSGFGSYQNYEKFTGSQPSSFAFSQNNANSFPAASNGFGSSQNNENPTGVPATGSGSSFQKYESSVQAQSNAFGSSKPAVGKSTSFQNYQKPNGGQANGSGPTQKYEKPAEGQSNDFGSFQSTAKADVTPSNRQGSFQNYEKPVGSQANVFGSFQKSVAHTEDHGNAFGSFQRTTTPAEGQSNAFGSFHRTTKPEGQPNAFGSFQNSKKQAENEPAGFKSPQYNFNQEPSAFGTNQPSSSVSGIHEAKPKSNNNFDSGFKNNNFKSAFGNNGDDDDTVSVEAPASNFNRPSLVNSGAPAPNAQTFSSNRQYLGPHSTFGNSGQYQTSQRSPSFGSSPQSGQPSQVNSEVKKFGSLGFSSGQSQAPAQQYGFNAPVNSNSNSRTTGGPTQESQRPFEASSKSGVPISTGAQQGPGQKSFSSGGSIPYRYDVPSVAFLNSPVAPQTNFKADNQFNSPGKPEGDKFDSVGSHRSRPSVAPATTSQFQPSLFRSQPASSFGSAFSSKNGQSSAIQKPTVVGSHFNSNQPSQVKNQQAQDENGGYLY